MKDNNKVTIGKIGSPFGVYGLLKIHSFAEPKANILDYKTWFLNRPHSKVIEWQEFKVLEAKPHGKIFVVNLDGITAREDAALLTNSHIAVLRDELPDLEQGEHYHQDLIGLTVIGKDGSCLGKVAEFFTTGANEVMVVKGDVEEYLIPYIEDHHILEVDIPGARILVDFEYQ